MSKGNQHYVLNTALRELRKQRGWTQAELAEVLGVTDLTVRRWERGSVLPSTYHVKKLCDLFEKTPEELGIVKSEDPEDAVEQPMGSTSEQYVSSSRTLPVQTAPIDAKIVILDNGWMEQATVQRHRGLLVFLGLVLILSLGIGIWQPMPVAGTELYHADWSQGFDSWSGFPNWQWSGKEGGMLITNDTVANNVLFAPYHPSVVDYVVEVQIKRMGYSGSGGQAYGIAVRMTESGGYICGVGIHYVPEHFFPVGLILQRVTHSIA